MIEKLGHVCLPTAHEKSAPGGSGYVEGEGTSVNEWTGADPGSGVPPNKNNLKCTLLFNSVQYAYVFVACSCPTSAVLCMHCRRPSCTRLDAVFVAVATTDLRHCDHALDPHHDHTGSTSPRSGVDIRRSTSFCSSSDASDELKRLVLGNLDR